MRVLADLQSFALYQTSLSLAMPSLLNFLFAVTALSASLGAAVPTGASYVLHEKRGAPSRSWVKRDRVDADALLPIKIGLKQKNLHKGYSWLMEV